MSRAGAASATRVSAPTSVSTMLPLPRLPRAAPRALDYAAIARGPQGGNPVRAALLFLSLLGAALLLPGPVVAKGTGLIFVSNEKTNNIIVLDPKDYRIVRDVKVSRRPRDMHFN